MTWVRRSLYILGGIVLAIPVLILLAWGLVNVGAVQRQLGPLVSDLASSPDMTISVEDVGGSLPFAPTIGRVTIADRDGPWLELKGVEAQVEAGALLDGQANVTLVRAAEVHVLRAPAPSTEPEPPPEPGPLIPELPLSVNVGELDLPRIVIAPALAAGEEVALKVAGGALVPASAGDVRIDLDAERLDGKPMTLGLELGFDRATSVLDLDLQVSEPQGGLIARLAQLPGLPAIALTAKGTGPLEGWKGRLDASAERLAGANLDVTLGVQPALSVQLAGTMTLGELAPPAARQVVGDAFTVEAAVRQDDNLLRIERAEVRAAALSAGVDGTLGLDDQALALAARAQVPELAAFASLIGAQLAGSAEVTAKVSGTIPAPALVADLDGANLVYEAFSADAATAHAVLEPPADDGSQRFDVTATAKAPRQAGQPFPGLDGDAEVRLAGVRDPQGLTLETARFAAAGTTVVAQGRIDDAYNRIDITTDLDVAPYPGVLTSGRSQARIEAKGTLMPLGLDLVVDAQGRDLVPADPQAARLTGRNPRLSLKARLEDGAARIDDLVLDTPLVKASGSMTLADQFQKGEGRFSVTAADLAPIGAVAGTPLAGDLKADIRFSGTMQAPTATADIVADNLVVQGNPLGRTTATLNYQGQGGRVEVATTLPVPVTLATPVALRDQTIVLDDLRLTVPGGGMQGRIVAAFAGTATGTLSGSFSDLGPLARVAGQDLKGAADLKLDLTAPGGRQQASLTLNGRSLALAGNTIGRLDVDGRLTDLAGPDAQATVRLADANLGGRDLDTLNATVSVSKGNGTFTVKGQGPAPDRLRLDTGGRFTLGPTLRLEVERLVASWKGQEIRSRSRFSVASGPDGIALDGLDLALAGGRISGSARLAGEAVNARIQATAVPLSLVQMVMPDGAPEGTLNATIVAGGTMAAPTADVTVTLRGFRPSQAMLGDAVDMADVPRVNVDLKANWRNNRLAADLGVTGIQNVDVTATAALPLAMIGGVPAVPPGGVLDIRAKGNAELASLLPFIPLGDDKLAGRAAFDARIGGTLDVPNVAGTIRLSDARYVSATYGTTIERLNLEAAGNGQRIEIRSLTATDGGDGRLTGSGAVDLSGQPFAITIEATNFHVTRLDTMEIETAANMRIGGTLQKTSVAGTITLTRGEIGIPEPSAPSVAIVQVTEINVPGQAPRPRPKPAEVPPEAPETPAGAQEIDLDIRLSVPGKLFVRGRGLESEWKGDMHVTGTAAKPVVLGRIEAVRGDFTLGDKTFDIAEGRIDLSTSDRIDPRINLTAQTQTDDILAKVIIEGPVADPSLRLAAEPELPQDQILSRVLFGSDVASLSAGQAAQLAQTALQLSGKGGGGMLDSVRRSLGLDRLSLGGGDEGLASSTISAGSYVAEDVYVGVEQGLGANSSKVKVEVEVIPNVKVYSSAGASGSTGVGLSYEYDY